MSCLRVAVLGGGLTGVAAALELTLRGALTFRPLLERWPGWERSAGIL